MTVAILSILQAEPTGGLSEALSSRPLLALGSLFLAGVVTSVTPCMYPMIPITASVISGTSREDQTRGRTIGLTLTYALGLALLYATLGMLAGLSGTLFGSVSASPWALFAIGNVLILFALFMLDVIPLPMPRRLLEWASKKEGGSYGAVFVLGARPATSTPSPHDRHRGVALIGASAAAVAVDRGLVDAV